MSENLSSTSKRTLKLNALSFDFDQQKVLKDINLVIESGQIGCLLGPSGCGKSTLLRLIAGFEQPKSGEILIGNECVADSQQMQAPQHRQVGMLFQDLALFPHLNITDNIAFGLHQLDKSEQSQRVNELLDLCRLQEFKSRYPHQLSGGQRQRVALARAMAPRPKLILLDEPFSSVETGLQSELAQDVRSMLKADNSTALWVTHSLDEAFAVSDQMGVILNGQLLQWSSPLDLYDNPSDPDVIQFLNHAVLVTGQLTTDGLIETQLGHFKLSNPEQFNLNDLLQIGIKKKHLQVNSSGAKNATISNAVYQGGQYLLTASMNNGDVIQCHHPESHQLNKQVNVGVNRERIYQGFKISPA